MDLLHQASMRYVRRHPWPRTCHMYSMSAVLRRLPSGAVDELHVWMFGKRLACEAHDFCHRAFAFVCFDLLFVTTSLAHFHNDHPLSGGTLCRHHQHRIKIRNRRCLSSPTHPAVRRVPLSTGGTLCCHRPLRHCARGEKRLSLLHQS